LHDDDWSSATRIDSDNQAMLLVLLRAVTPKHPQATAHKRANTHTATHYNNIEHNIET
jgi:hypothetical protein